MSANQGTVFLVGAGPGDPGLITVRGRWLLEQADVVIHDRLVSRELLACVRADAEVIDARKLFGRGEDAQEKISALSVDRAKRGKAVVRLKGGDPFVFGRGWEEWRACRDAALRCVVVPGVSSALAVPAAVGIPCTVRGTSRTFAVVTARAGIGEDAAALNYKALAEIDTVIIMMGRSNLDEVARSLIAAGRDPATPAACIERGTTPRLRSLRATLATVAQAADREDLRAPVVTVVGQVARCADEYRAYLNCVHVDSIEPPAPLAGKRVVITRSSSSAPELEALLAAEGAVTISAPMIRIDFPQEHDALAGAAGKLDSYGWIAFESVHGVRGFLAGLNALGRDARALAACKVAAVGPITAAALVKRGINPELVRQPYSTAGLAEDLIVEIGGKPDRVLCPCGDMADRGLTLALRRAAVPVDEVVVYHTVALTPPENVLREIRSGVDAVTLCSPAAARRFAQLGLNIAGAAVACMGPSTASAARQAGLDAAVEAGEHTDRGLVAALSSHFGSGDRRGLNA